MKTTLLFFLLAFAACHKLPAVVITPPGTIPSTQPQDTAIFLDDFSRANTSPGSLGMAPDGSPYELSGVGLPSARIYNHQYISTSTTGPTYASKYFAGKNISRVSITFTFTQTPALVGGLALITSTDSAGIALKNMNHWVFTGNGGVGSTIWHDGAQNQLPAFSSPSKIQSYAMGKSYTISLTMDGMWVHCSLPDGSTVDMYDPRVPKVAGRRVIWEIGAGIAVTRHEVYSAE